jgi:phage tail sheath protein FI
MSAYTYPGVYIQELPSGVHTITGVATSIAAFVGWASQGPTDEATLILSWQDFATQFGGLDSRSYLGYAVNQFFANGGQQAYIVRLTDGTATPAALDITGLVFDSSAKPAASTVTIISNSVSAWVASTSYSLGDLVTDSNNAVQRCTTAGYSAATAPAAWATTAGAITTDDNGIIPWAPSTAYPTVGELVTDTNGHVQRCTTPGTSDTTVPPWPTTLGAITHEASPSTVVWTLVALGFVTWELVAASVGTGGLTLSAVNPGLWGGNYSVQIQPRTDDYTRFTLSVIYTNPTTLAQSTVESFANLSLSPTDAQSRYVVNILNESSNFLNASMDSTTALAISQLPSLPTAPLPSTPAVAALSPGTDGAVLQPTATAGTPGGFEGALLPSSGTGGVNLLSTVPIFNILCVPGEIDPQTIQDLQAFCVGERAFLIVDSDPAVPLAKLENGPNNLITGVNSINSALYFPWVNSFDPQLNATRAFPPSGFVAGLYAATDSARHVWKAPAGIDASLTGESGLAITLTDPQNGVLNVQAINCLRNFRVYGDVIWGSRTLRGNDEVGSEWKYVPIRRFALYLESSLYDGTQWVVFEPNDETLWGQVRLNVGAFMQGLFLQGAFAGTTPQQAYFVKCDGENNPPASVAQGIVNILVGYAPLYPAEFVVIQIQQQQLAPTS